LWQCTNETLNRAHVKGEIINTNDYTAQRPCTRCLSVGKEESCIDVQHKKRGRPRLRDEREIRYDGTAPPYGQSHTDGALRGSTPHYSSRETPFAGGSAGPLQRSNSYRVLKSQSANSAPLPLPGSTPSHYLNQPIAPSSMYHQPSTNGLIPALEPCYAFMNLEFRVVKSSASFQDAVGIPSLDSRRIQELVPSTEVDKVNRILKIFENERRQREPAYRLPIYVKPEDDRIVQSVGFGQEESAGISLNVQETLTFVGADGRYRPCHVRMGLSRKNMTYFIVATMPSSTSMPTPFPQQYSVTPHFSRELMPRDQQYAYQSAPQNFVQPAVSPQYAQQAQNFGFQTPGNMPNGASVSPFPYAQQQSGYNSNLHSYQGSSQPPVQTFNATNSLQQYPVRQSQQYQNHAADQHPSQGQQQRDLQLPPIRDAAAENSGDSRSKGGRVDIGGLIDNTASTR